MKVSLEDQGRIREAILKSSEVLISMFPYKTSVNLLSRSRMKLVVMGH
jgi:hypothetical protein